MSFRILNQTATIEARTATDDRAGGQDYTWAERYASVKGSLQPTSTAETGMWDRESVAKRFNFYMKWLTGIVETDRLVIDSVYYDITGVENLGGLNKWLRLAVERHS